MESKQLSSAIDAVKTAILTEMQGYELYKGAAERTKDPEARKMFEMLADEEEGHSRMLQEQFKSLMENEAFAAMPEEGQGEGFETLVADPQWRKTLKFGNMELAVISIGADLEARAVTFYKKCAETTQDPEGKKVFEWLVLWEKDHLKWMQELEQELQQGFWADQGFSPM